MRTLKMLITIQCILFIVACSNNEISSERSEANEQSQEISKVNNEIETIFIHGNYVVYESEIDLYEDADLVVLANPIDSFVDREHVARYTPPQGGAPKTLEDFFTRTTIKIKKVLKSPKGLDIQDNSELDIIEPVSIIENGGVQKKFTVENYIEIEKDNHYIIYLKDNTYGEFGVINMNNGRFNLKSEEQLQSLMQHSHNDDIDKHEEMKKQVFERFENEIKDYDL